MTTPFPFAASFLTPRLALLIGLGVALCHWAAQVYGIYGLMFDEAQYWFWGKNPAFGYYSKPPVIAWLMGAGTWLIGDSAFGVKWPAPLLHLATAWLVYRIARQQAEEALTARWAALLYLTSLLITGASAFFSTDTPLLLCWTAALYSLLAALSSPTPARWWLLTGLLAGLGLLSKYTMGMFALSALLALLAAPQGRAALRSPWPYLGALLALAVFTPNLLWNLNHHFATLSHTNENLFSKQLEIYPADLLEFLGAQIGIFGPLPMLALLAAAWRHRRGADTPALLHYFCWPLFLTGLGVSLIAGAQAQWIAPCYIAGSIIAAAWMRRHAPKWLPATLALNLLLLAVFYALSSLPLRNDPTERLFVFNRLAEPLARWTAQAPDSIIVSDERKIAAALTYQLRDPVTGAPHPVYKWNPSGGVHDHYDLITDPEILHGKRLLLVSRSPSPHRLPPDARQLAETVLGRTHFYFFLIPQFQGFAP